MATGTHAIILISFSPIKGEGNFSPWSPPPLIHACCLATLEMQHFVTTGRGQNTENWTHS